MEDQASWGSCDVELPIEEGNSEELEGILGDILKDCVRLEKKSDVELWGELEDVAEASSVEPEVEPVVTVKDLKPVAKELRRCVEEEDAGGAVGVLSRLTDDQVKSVVSDIWCSLDGDESRLAAVKVLSCARPARVALCSALQLWLNQGDFHSALALCIKSSIWLDSSFYEHLVVPYVISTPSAAQDFIVALNPSQRSELLPVLACAAGPVSVLASIAESSISIDATSLSSLVTSLTQRVDALSTDRHMGQLLLAIATCLHPGSHPPDLVQRAVTLCQSFKGPMRFRISKTLSALSHK